MGTVWDRATEFCSDHLAAIVPIAVLLIFVPLSVQGHLTPMIAGSSGAAMLALRLLNLALSIVSLTGQLAIVALAIAPGLNAGGAMAAALRRLPPAIGAILMLMAGVVLLSAPAVAMMAAAGIDPARMGQMSGEAAVPMLAVSPVLAWSLTAYIIVALVVALWLAARLVLLYPVVVAERRGFGVVARSFALTRRLALPIIGVLLLYALVSTISVLAVRTVFGSVLALAAGGIAPGSIGGIVVAVIVGAVTTAFTVLGAAFTAKLYGAANGQIATVSTIAPAGAA